jgi:L-lysine 2,3-aminomutase
MYYTPFDGYYYSRPVAYKSYYPRLTKQSILQENDADTQDVLRVLQKSGINFVNNGGLSRGITFDDWEVGKRVFNHHNEYAAPEYYLHQWKPTNDCCHHPCGSHYVSKNFAGFVKELQNVISTQRKTYK